MATVMIGIGGVGATTAQGSFVKTMALGSCVAVIFLVPKTRCIGMVHVALPDSALDAKKKQLVPGHFADSGVPALLNEVCKVGGPVTMRDVYVKIAGGANMLGAASTFDIGRRNVLAVKKALWQMGSGPMSEDIEGFISRTVTVSVDSGTVELSSPAKGTWTI